MVSDLLPSDIPRDRTDVLHLLRQHGDDLDTLSADQIAALRKIYRLDNCRSVDELMQAGLIETPSIHNDHADKPHQKGDC